ncbi:MAG: Holliday junction resolvase RuvX [Bacteroidota bacterium]|nr:Holliday junction resolvase RuvX [Bacteroidota bacterium]
MTKSRVLGIDYGTKRVGVAIADPMRMFAQPVGTYSPNAALDVIGRIHDEDGVEVVVIGWPLGEDGSTGRMTKLVGEYINRIRKRVPGVEFVRRDERNSSERAKELIRNSECPSLKTTGRERIDTAAAGILLQEYLDEASN